MNTELFIENYRLDISTDISALLTFALDSLKDFSERTTTFSKTIVLPGTANNNKLFGHIFQIGQANQYNDLLDNVGYNFNAAKSADCIIFQDQMQTFKGQIRLLQVNVDKGRPEYEVAVFGELAGLNVSLSSGLLEDLDFSAYDHEYNKTKIAASWDNTPGTGYYYPLADYGNYSTLKHDWDIRTFRPALYVREYIDKMITAAGYRWSSALFDTDRFKRLVIPHNRKTITKRGSSLLSANIIADTYQITTVAVESLNFNSISGTNFAGNGPLPYEEIIYSGVPSIYADVVALISGTYTSDYGINVELHKYNGVTDVLLDSVQLPGVMGIPDQPFSITFTQPGIQFITGDILYISLGNVDTAETNFITVTSGSISVGSQAATIVNVNPGDTLLVNDTIPKNVRQVDFLLSIVKLFNLYVYEDRLDTKLIHFTPYVDFYSTDSAHSVDWTYKLNRDKVLQIKPMSELTAKKYEFKFKQDSDYYNELYRKRYGQGYGDYIYDSAFEFSEQTKSFELIFSATPLVGYAGEEKVYSTIFKQTGNAPTVTEETIDSNIRIWQTKKITGVASWDIKDGSSSLVSLTDYGYAGHLDDPDAPDNDLNFGALRELFFTLTSGNLSDTQFNVYWSSYMAEITDKDSKLLSAYFHLTTKDIIELDFSKKVYIDGVLFKLTKIEDYNVTTPSDCRAQLLKVNYLLY